MLKPLLGAIPAPALSKMFSLFCHKEEKELPTTAYDDTSVGDPDPQDPHVFGLPDPNPLVRDTDPDPNLAPDPSLFS